jgi:hypothetical protein
MVCFISGSNDRLLNGLTAGLTAGLSLACFVARKTESTFKFVVSKRIRRTPRGFKDKNKTDDRVTACVSFDPDSETNTSKKVFA